MTLVDMPKANENLTEATLDRWLVAEGAVVAEIRAALGAQRFERLMPQRDRQRLFDLQSFGNVRDRAPRLQLAGDGLSQFLHVFKRRVTSQPTSESRRELFGEFRVELASGGRQPDGTLFERNGASHRYRGVA